MLCDVILELTDIQNGITFAMCIQMKTSTIDMKLLRRDDMRTIIAVIEVDDNKAIAEDLGTIDYLDREFGWLTESGISLKDARILDDDDKDDAKAIELVNEIFN
jgi:hypothetical protein